MKTKFKYYLVMAFAITAASCSKDDPDPVSVQPPSMQEEVDNRAPLPPTDPLPKAGDTIFSIVAAKLQWTASDPDGDALSFDLLLGTTPDNLQAIAVGLDESQFELDLLEAFTTYYWQVIAKDGSGAAASSATFSFETSPTGFIPDDDFRLTTQAEVDTFGAQGYNYFSGDLIIGADVCLIDGTEIVDLSPLEDLVVIEGNLTIQHTMILDLEGLDNIKSLNDGSEVQFLYINHNPLLENLKGLEGLKNTEQLRVQIIDNPALTALEGLNRFSVLEELIIANNPLLMNLEGLESLQRVKNMAVTRNEALENFRGLRTDFIIEDGINIAQNTHLENLNGLHFSGSVTQVFILRNAALIDISALSRINTAETVHILENPMLRHLTGLENLSTVNGDFFIGGNTVLIDLSALGNLTQIGSIFGLQANPQLTDMRGLENLVTIGDALFIINHPNLKSLKGLNELRNIADLNVFNNEVLLNLEGLESIETLQVLEIRGNTNLTSLKGLDNVMAVQDNMTLNNNPVLHDFCAPLVAAQDTNLDNITRIEGNAFNPSVEDIRKGNCME